MFKDSLDLMDLSLLLKHKTYQTLVASLPGNISKIRPYPTQHTTQLLIQIVVILDYCKSSCRASQPAQCYSRRRFTP